MTLSSTKADNDIVDFRTKEELVYFINVQPRYTPGNDVTIQYTLGSRVIDTPLDWIGIFRSDWRDINQPVTFQWAPIHSINSSRPRDRMATLPSKCIQALQNPTDTFQFVYVNSQRQVIGVSPSFGIDEGRSELENVESSGIKYRDDESINGDVKSRKSDSPVMLSSDDEWDFHTQSSHQLSSTSFSDLSDIPILPKPAPKEHTTINFNADNKCIKQQCETSDIKSTRHVLSDGRQISQNKCKQHHRQVQLSEANKEINKSTTVREHPYSNNTSLILPLEYNIIIGSSSLIGEHDNLAVKQEHERTSGFLRTSDKQETDNRVKKMSDPLLSMSPSLIEKLRIIDIENSSDDDYCDDGKHTKVDFYHKNVENISTNEDRLLKNLTFQRNGINIKEFEHVSASNRDEKKKVKKKQVTTQQENRDSQRSICGVDNTFTNNSKYDTGDLCNQKRVLQSSMSDFASQEIDKSHKHSKTMEHNAIEHKNILTITISDHHHQETKDLISISQCLLKITDKHNPCVELDKEAPESQRMVDRQQIPQHKKYKKNNRYFRYRLLVKEFSDVILPRLKFTGGKMYKYPVEEMKTKRLRHSRNTKGILRKTKRLQTKHGRQSHKKVALLLNRIATPATTSKTKFTNPLPVFTNPLPVFTNPLPVFTFRGYKDSSQEESSVNHTVLTDDMKSQGNSGDICRQSQTNWPTIGKCISSFPFSLNKSLPPTSKVVPESEGYKGDGMHKTQLLQKNIYLNAGILERIKHHLSKCDESTTINKDMLINYQEINKDQKQQKITDTCLISLSHQPNGTKSEIPSIKHPTILVDSARETNTSSIDSGKVLEKMRPGASSFLPDSAGPFSGKPRLYQSSRNEEHPHESCPSETPDGVILDISRHDIRGSPNEPIKKLNSESKSDVCGSEKNNMQLNKQLERPHIKYEHQTLDSTDKKWQQQSCVNLNDSKTMKELENALLKDNQFCRCDHNQGASVMSPSASKFLDQLTDFSANFKTTSNSSSQNPKLESIAGSFHSCSNSSRSVHSIKEYSETIQSLLERNEETGDDNACLTWPMPSFIQTTSRFGPWITSSNPPKPITTTDASFITQNSLYVLPKLRNYVAVCDSCVSKYQISKGGRIVTRKHHLRNHADKGRVIDLDRVTTTSVSGSAAAQQGLFLKTIQEQLKVTPHLGHFRQNVNVVRHRRIPLIKSGRDLKTLIRAQAEIMRLKSKVDIYDIEIKNLTCQISALKEDLSVESNKAFIAHFKCLQLKEKIDGQRVQLRDSMANETGHTRSILKVVPTFKTNESQNDNYEPPQKKRRIAREMFHDTWDEAELCRGIPVHENVVIWPNETDLTEKCGLSSYGSITEHNRLNAAPTSIDIVNTQKHGNDIHIKFPRHSEMSACNNVCIVPATYSPEQKTCYSSPVNSLACTNLGAYTTECHPIALTSYEQICGEYAKFDSPCLDQRFEYTTNNGTCYPFSHKIGDHSLQQCTTATSSPFDEPYNVTLSQRTSHKTTSSQEPSYIFSHQISPQISSSHRYNSLQCTSPQIHLKRMQYSPLSCNNSRNKSRDSSASDYHHVISPLSSPRILPITTITTVASSSQRAQPSTEKESVKCTSSRTECDFFSKDRDQNPNVHPFSHQRVIDEPKSSLAISGTQNASGNWPSKTVDDSQYHRETASKSSVFDLKLKALSNLTSDEVKSKARVAPFEIPQNPPMATTGKHKVFAFASGATVCPKPGSGDTISGGLCRWLKSRGDDDVSGFLDKLTSSHLLTGGNQHSTLDNVKQFGIAHKHPAENTHESPISQFQSCFLRQLVPDGSSHAQTDVQQVSQQNVLINQCNQHYQHHNNKQQEQTNKTPKPYRYPRHLLSMPPSELPYPPLSPFHHPSSTQLRTADLSATEQYADGALFNKSFLENSQDNDLAKGYHQLIQQGGSNITTSSIIRKQIHHHVEDSIENSTRLQNEHTLLDLGYQSSRIASEEKSFGTCGALFDNSDNKRQIEATVACRINSQQ